MPAGMAVSRGGSSEASPGLAVGSCAGGHCSATAETCVLCSAVHSHIPSMNPWALGTLCQCELLDMWATREETIDVKWNSWSVHSWWMLLIQAGLLWREMADSGQNIIPAYQMVIMRANTCLYSFWAGCWAGHSTVQDVAQEYREMQGFLTSFLKGHGTERCSICFINVFISEPDQDANCISDRD